MTSAVALVMLVATHLPPAVLGVVAEEDGAPTAVRLAHGLATLDEEGRWRFVCPETWDRSPDAPLALAMPERRIIAIGVQKPYELDVDAVAEARVAPGVSSLTAKKLARAGDAVFALASTPEGAIVVRFDPGVSRPVLEASQSIHSITGAADRFLVSTSTASGVRIETHELDGTTRAAINVASTEAIGATSAIELAGDQLYAVFAKPASWTLARIDGDVATAIATSTTPILGPALAGTAAFVIAHSKLQRIDGDALSIADDTRAYTCIDAAEARAYVCARTKLFTLDDHGAPSSLAFDIAEVKGPRLAAFDEGQALACRIQWSDFAREAGLDPAIPEDKPPNPPPNTGCSCRNEMSDIDTASFVLVLAIILSRRTSTDRR